jgi:hypothetical protein
VTGAALNRPRQETAEFLEEITARIAPVWLRGELKT